MALIISECVPFSHGLAREAVVAHEAHARAGRGDGGGGRGRPQVRRRREFCEFDDVPCLSLLKHLMKVQGGGAIK